MNKCIENKKELEENIINNMKKKCIKQETKDQSNVETIVNKFEAKENSNLKESKEQE